MLKFQLVGGDGESERVHKTVFKARWSSFSVQSSIMKVYEETDFTKLDILDCGSKLQCQISKEKVNGGLKL